MSVLYCDFETRGSLDLREVGLHRYSRHRDTDVWCMAWAIDDEEPQLWAPDDEGPDFARFYNYVYHGRANDGCAIVAYNAPFEMEIWENIMLPRYEFPTPDSTTIWQCTMAQAYAMGLPGLLEEAAAAAGIKAEKDMEGRGLMMRMARPRRMDGDCPVWWDEPEKLQRLYEYCKQDVRVERELYKRLRPLSDYERKVWLMNHAINQRGVAVDIDTAKAAIVMAARVKTEGDSEIAQITGGAVQTNSALIAMKSWISDHGVPAAKLAKDDVIELLESEDLPAPVHRVLSIRQEIGKASVAKLDKLVAVSHEGRVYNTTQYHAAATGRFAGRGVQVHNLIRDVPEADQMEDIMRLVRAGDPHMLTLMYGPPLSAISRCLRGFFVAPQGKLLVAGDFSAVEGRGTAWISGEEWKLQAFRNADAGTGPGIYELAYAKSFGVDPKTIKNPSPERQIGKVQELLFGFGGGVGAARRGGGDLVKGRPDSELDEWKVAWRKAHKRVVATWRELEDAALNAVRAPGKMFAAGAGARGVKFKMSGSFLWCRLPSGRLLCYAYPKILPGQYGDQLTYMTVPGPTEVKVHDAKNSAKWARVATYGGSLMENVVQALCRDLLVDCMIRLHEMGAKIVLHVHDEIVVEVAQEKAIVAREAMKAIMNAPPAWAADFPLKTKPAIMRRYGK